MMIVDDQAGSKDLFPYIRKLTPDCLLTRIDPPFGDIAWLGEGPDGNTVSVGVEYKQLADVLDCIGSGRYAGHQLPGMIDVAKYNRIYLLVEYGRVRADRVTGVLQKPYKDRNGNYQWKDITKGGRGWTYRDMEHWYTTMEEFAQVRVVRTFDEHESARWVVAKHSWWTSKGWSDHKSLQQFHVPPPPTATFAKPSLIRRIAKELPSVGWERSMAVAAKFTSVQEMINANEQTWATIDGIGKGIASKITKDIRGGK